MTTRMGKDECPVCGYPADAASPIGEEDDIIPAPGCVSICLNCAEYLYFADDMKLEPFPQILFEDLPQDAKDIMQSYRYAIRKLGFGARWDDRVKKIHDRHKDQEEGNNN